MSGHTLKLRQKLHKILSDVPYVVFLLAAHLYDLNVSVVPAHISKPCRVVAAEGV